MTGFLSEWWDRLVYAWWQLDHRAKALVAALPAWASMVAVVVASVGPSASASTPGPVPPAVLPPVPGATSSMRYEDGQNVLYARAPDGSWKPLRSLEPDEVPGQFAKFTATSPDRRFVSYVKADDERLNNASINLVDVETGDEQTIAAIPQGFYPVSPVWSPDASRIAFIKKSADQSKLELWNVHVASGELVMVPTQEEISPQAFYGSNSTPLVWSEDGESLSYTVPDRDKGKEIRHDVDLETGRVRTEEGKELPAQKPCDVPVFSQNDPAWSDNTMLELRDTIGDAGCALTSTAMILNYYGDTRDPGELNECLGSAAEPVYWAVAAERQCNDGSARFEEYAEFSWGRLNELMAEGRPVVLGYAGGMTGSHYVVVTSGYGSDGANYQIIDPWDGTSWKTIDYYASKGYSPEWLVIYRGKISPCQERRVVPPVQVPDLSTGTSSAGVEGTWRWRDRIVQVAAQTGVDPDIMQAIMALESGGNPNSIGIPHPTLGTAMGLMQVMSDDNDWHWVPVTEKLGHFPSREEMLDPENNILASTVGLLWRHSLGGRWNDWLIVAVGYFGATTPDGQITGSRDANGTDGWMYYDRVRANLIEIRARLGRGGDLPDPPSDVNRPSNWPAVGTIDMIFGGASYGVSQGFGYTGFSPGPGAYDYSSAYGLQAGDHAGVDLAVPYGTALYAPLGANVVYAGDAPYFQPKHVDLTIPGSEGVECARIIFGHMSYVAVAVGNGVQPTNFLGDSGTAGTGPHLHLEVRVPDNTTSSGCRAVDPRIFFGTGGDVPTLTPPPHTAPPPVVPPTPGGPPPPVPAVTPAAPVATGTATAMATGTVEPTSTGTVEPTPVSPTVAATETPTATSPAEQPPGPGTPVVVEPTATPTPTAEGGASPAIEPTPTPTPGAEEQVPPAEPGASPEASPVSPPGGSIPQPIVSNEISAGQMPEVTVKGPQDWVSYPEPVVLDYVKVDYPLDPNAVVNSSVPDGTVFDTEGKYEIITTVQSPTLPNGQTIHTDTFYVDLSPPTVNAEVSGQLYQAEPTGGSLDVAMIAGDGPVLDGAGRRQVEVNASCYNQEAIVTLLAEDAVTPVIAIVYRIDGGEWHYYTNNGIAHPVSISRHGNHTVEFYAVDAAGNQTPSQQLDLCVVVNQDAPIPVVDETPTPTPTPTPGLEPATTPIPAARERAVVAVTSEPTSPAATATATATPTATPAASPVETPPASPASSPTSTATGTPTATPTSTPTGTPPPTATSPPAPTAAATSTATTAPPRPVPTSAPPPLPPVSTFTPAPTQPPPAPTLTATVVPPAPTLTATAIPPTLEPTEEPTATPGPGSLKIRKEDGEGEELDGACFSLQTLDGTELENVCDEDDDDEDGETTFEDVPPGTYVLRETVAPAGYVTGEPFQVTVEAGAETTYRMVNTVRLGAIEIFKQDQNEAPLRGACFQLYADAGGGQQGSLVRDEACTDNAEGRVTFPGLAPGNYVIVETQAPPGYVKAPPRAVAVLSGSTVPIVYQNQLEIGFLVVEKVDEADQRLLAACFDIYTINEEGGRGERVAGLCDREDGNEDGFTGFPALPGDYLVVEASPPTGFQAAEDQRVEIAPNQTATLRFVDVPIAGSLTIYKIDEETRAPLPGACFTIYPAADVNGTPVVAAACDDSDGADGTTTVADLQPGDYVLVEIAIPPGYQPALDTPVTITAGQPAEVEIPNAPARGSLAISKVDEASQPLGGVCFELYADGGGGARGAFVTERCDSADGADDGAIAIADLRPGGYVLAEQTPPTGYNAAPDQTVVIVANQVTTAQVQNLPASATLTIHKVNEAGETLTGACFELYTAAADGGPDEFVDEGCDGPPPEITGTGIRAMTSLPLVDEVEDGFITFTDLEPGEYALLEWQAPEGYDEPSQAFLVGYLPGGETTLFEVRNQERVYSLTIHKVDDGGNPLADACFDLHGNAGGSPGAYVTSACTDAGFTPPGTAVIDDLAAGDYMVVETSAPLGYEASAPVAVTVGPGSANEVQVVNQPGTTVTLRVDTFRTGTDIRLPGACYSVVLASDLGTSVAGACDEDDGSDDGVTFILLEPGQYVLYENRAPSGYVPELDLLPFTIDADMAIPVYNDPLVIPGPLYIYSVDEFGQPLPGACFLVYNALTESPEAQGCDRAGGGTWDDGTPDGQVYFNALSQSSSVYRVEETEAPPGYQGGEPQTIQYHTTEPMSVTFTNTPLGSQTPIPVPDPTAGLEPTLEPTPVPATYTLTLTANEGWYNFPVPNVCYYIYPSGGGPQLPTVCDDDGDGVAQAVSLLAGDYTVNVDQFQPSGFWTTVPSRFVPVYGDQVLAFAFGHQNPAFITVTLVDSNGTPIQSGPFQLTRGGALLGSGLTDAGGHVWFSDLPPYPAPAPPYCVAQTGPPPGGGWTWDPNPQCYNLAPGENANAGFVNTCPSESLCVTGTSRVEEGGRAAAGAFTLPLLLPAWRSRRRGSRRCRGGCGRRSDSRPGRRSSPPPES